MENDILDDLRFDVTGDIRVEELEAFIGSSSEYYIKQWSAYKEGKLFSFNIGAFLFGFGWMLFRKMIKIAIFFCLIILGIGVLQDVVFEMLMDISGDVYLIIDRIITITTSVAVGFLGNRLYLQYVEKEIYKMREKGYGQQEYYAALREKGGVSWLYVIIVLLGLFLLGYIFVILI